MRPQAPCKDCENRHMGCHSSCQLYLDYKERNDKRREEDYQRREEGQKVRSVIVEGKARMKKSRATNRFGK